MYNKQKYCSFDEMAMRWITCTFHYLFLRKNRQLEKENGLNFMINFKAEKENWPCMVILRRNLPFFTHCYLT